MTRPWEEEWVVDRRGNNVSTKDGPVATVHGEDEGHVVQRKHLIAAAPDMARALLASGGRSPSAPDAGWHTVRCWETSQDCTPECRATQAALTKAGVRLP